MIQATGIAIIQLYITEISKQIQLVCNQEDKTNAAFKKSHQVILIQLKNVISKKLHSDK